MEKHSNPGLIVSGDSADRWLPFYRFCFRPAVTERVLQIHYGSTAAMIVELSRFIPAGGRAFR